MSNPLYQMLGGNTSPMGNMAQMIQQFNQFRASFQGDPKAEVMKMLQSGRVSQAQLNQAQQMAQQMIKLLHK